MQHSWDWRKYGEQTKEGTWVKGNWYHPVEKVLSVCMKDDSNDGGMRLPLSHGCSPLCQRYLFITSPCAAVSSHCPQREEHTETDERWDQRQTQQLQSFGWRMRGEQFTAWWRCCERSPNLNNLIIIIVIRSFLTFNSIFDVIQQPELSPAGDLYVILMFKRNIKAFPPALNVFLS